MDDPFSDGEPERISDPYRSHAWVNIAVSTLMRNIGRASFRITRDGEFVTSELVFDLFRDVNPVMNRFDLWKVTSAWWFHVLILGKRRSGSSVTHTKPGFRRTLFLIHGRCVPGLKMVWSGGGSTLPIRAKFQFFLMRLSILKTGTPGMRFGVLRL